MSKILPYIFFLILITSCQKDPEISNSQEDFYLKVFGGSSTDGCYDIISNGENLYLTGSLNYKNSPDLFLIKTDKYGNEVEWSPKLFGTSGVEVGQSLTIDRNNNIIAAGYSQQPGSELTDVFVVKTSASGEELWSKRFGGPGNEKAFAVNSLVSNTIYVAGYTESVAFDFKKRQGWLLALSENGDSLWSQDYGTNFVPDELHGITEMKDSLLLIGTTQSIFGNFKQDVFLFILKKSTKGIENSTTLFRMGDETGIATLYTPAHEIYVLAYVQNNSVNNIVVWKLDENLQILKERQITADLSETPGAIKYLNGSVVVIGTAVNQQGNEDFLMYILDSELNTVSRNTYGAKGDQRGLSGTVTGDKVVIGGSTNSGNSLKACIFKTPEVLP